MIISTSIENFFEKSGPRYLHQRKIFVFKTRFYQRKTH